MQDPVEDLSSQEVKESASKEVPAQEQAVLEGLKIALATEKDKYLRLLAEFDNMRKRHERDRQELIKYAHEEVIIESLKIYDDLNRCLTAFKAKDGMDGNLLKGLEMVYANLNALMIKYEVKPIEAVGKVFDPNCMEVLMQQPTTEAADNVVLEVFETGYTLAGRVVRTAKVKVAKNTSEQ